jgi:hypothetical protein
MLLRRTIKKYSAYVVIDKGPQENINNVLLLANLTTVASEICDTFQMAIQDLLDESI